MHPATATGVIAGFVAALFPLLRDFVSQELQQSPAALLGDAWTTMLGHHDFYTALRRECEVAWSSVAIPVRLKPYFDKMACEDCGSALLQPAIDNDAPNATLDDRTHTVVCMACDLKTSSMLLLENVLLGELGLYDPTHGGEPPVIECSQCSHGTYVVAEAVCFFCEYRPKYFECAVCQQPLGLDDQDNGGLCGYHSNVMDND